MGLAAAQTRAHASASCAAHAVKHEFAPSGIVCHRIPVNGIVHGKNGEAEH
jgi:hypothetical protein